MCVGKGRVGGGGGGRRKASHWLVVSKQKM